MENYTTWDAILSECERSKESDGFCRWNCSCSGPSYSNHGPDFTDPNRPKGGTPVRGKCGLMGWVKD
jgi:hypothetical protein